MIIDSVTVGPFEENCYLIIDEASSAAVLVDPGDEGDRIVALASRRGVTPSEVWLTHAHLDHIGAIEAVRRAWPGIPVSLHPLDQPVYDFGSKSAAYYGLPWEQPAPPDRELGEAQRLQVGSLVFDVLHVPGHAPGHCAFFGNGALIGGDTIFAGSIGRTDLPLCDPAAFVRSLERLMELPDATKIHPGHGPATTIARERASNPFLNGVARIPGTARAPVSPRAGDA
jgi:glyoxylase-like metal-dependent hydrolase (beta-lactamase superfamily II)